MDPKNLEQYAAELKRLGEVPFRQQYVRPVLVGLGMVGELSDKRRPGTLAVHLHDLEQASETAGLKGRVWVVRRSQGGPPSGAGITAGRSAENDIVIPEYSVSQRHCQFNMQIGRILITDLDSYNGTYVDGRRIEARRAVPLHDGARVVLGRFGFEFLTEASFLERVKGLSPRR